MESALGHGSWRDAHTIVGASNTSADTMAYGERFRFVMCAVLSAAGKYLTVLRRSSFLAACAYRSRSTCQTEREIRVSDTPRCWPAERDIPELWKIMIKVLRWTHGTACGFTP